MKIIMEMRARGSLTEQQVLTAARFRKDPQRIRLAPTLWRTLHDVVIRERNLGEIEQSRGWPPPVRLGCWSRSCSMRSRKPTACSGATRRTICASAPNI